MKTIEKAHEMKHVAWIAIAALLLVALLGLAACSSSDDGTDESSDTGSTSGATADVQASDFENLDAVTLIEADATAPGSAGEQWGDAIAAYADELTGGKMTIECHHNSELGGDTDVMTQEQSNDIQLNVTQPATVVSFIDAMAVFDLPMAFYGYDGDAIETVLNGDNEFTQDLQAACEDAGVHNLGWLQNATYRETTANRDLSTLDDFNGFMIRTMENANHMAFWTALGAEPTPLAFSEVYFALQNGTVEGEENALDTIVGNSFQEVQKYCAWTNHILYANFITISKQGWEDLDPAYQDALNEAVAKATDDIRPTLLDIQDENMQEMEDAGMEFIEYDKDFVDQVLAIDGVQTLYDDIYDQTDGLSQKMLDELDSVA